MFSNRRLNSAIHLGARSPLRGGLPLSQWGSRGDTAEEQPLSLRLTPCFTSVLSTQLLEPPGRRQIGPDPALV